MAPVPGRVRVGPAGRYYSDWEGVVYPPRLRNRLEYLACFFEGLEINSSFYRPPSVEQSQSWLEKTASFPAFRFTAKLWRGFTHERERLSSWEGREWERGVGPLLESGRLGALLAQFPYSFHYTPENELYLRRLKRRFASWPLVLEVRHRSWNREKFFGFLREARIGFCNIDQPQVSYSLPSTWLVTSPTAYLRLHGRNAADWFRENAGRDQRYNYLYSDSQLDKWVERVAHMRNQAREVFVIANNHFRGQAICNCLELRFKIEGRPVEVPEILPAVYPRLAKIILSRSGGSY